VALSEKPYLHDFVHIARDACAAQLEGIELL
jgi:hypothetical protein